MHSSQDIFARNRIKSVTEILDLDEELKNIKLKKNPFF